MLQAPETPPEAGCSRKGAKPQGGDPTEDTQYHAETLRESRACSSLSVGAGATPRDGEEVKDPQEGPGDGQGRERANKAEMWGVSAQEPAVPTQHPGQLH